MGVQRHRRAGRCRAATLAIGIASVLVGCASGATPPADDPVFAGLDPVVVAEVLASPVARDRVAGDQGDEERARYQNMVRNFSACRSALAVYQQWVKSGSVPAFPAQPRPAHPAMWAADEDADIKNFQRLAAGGDIAPLRAELLDSQGCGGWIPAKPGDVSGPTVSDVVRGGK